MEGKFVVVEVHENKIYDRSRDQRDNLYKILVEFEKANWDRISGRPTSRKF